MHSRFRAKIRPGSTRVERAIAPRAGLDQLAAHGRHRLSPPTASSRSPRRRARTRSLQHRDDASTAGLAMQAGQASVVVIGEHRDRHQQHRAGADAGGMPRSTMPSVVMPGPRWSTSAPSTNSPTPIRWFALAITRALARTQNGRLRKVQTFWHSASVGLPVADVDHVQQEQARHRDAGVAEESGTPYGGQQHERAVLQQRDPPAPRRRAGGCASARWHARLRGAEETRAVIAP